MKTIAIVLVLMGAACGAAPRPNVAPQAPQPLDILNGAPAVTDEVLQQVIAATRAMAPKPMDLNDQTLIVHDYYRDVYADCATLAEGCYSHESRKIISLWPKEYRGIIGAANDAERNGYSASLLAHELGHLFFYQTTGDGDADHLHKEWFSDTDPTSICSRIYVMFAVAPGVRTNCTTPKCQEPVIDPNLEP